MKRESYERAKRWLVLVTLAGAVHRASAQLVRQPVYQEPQLITGRISEVSAGAYATGTYDTSTFKNSNGTFSHTYLFAGPSLGFNVDGSVYHPNLFQYNVLSDGAVGWSSDVSSGSGSTTRVNEFQYFGLFSANGTFLPNKPYHASVFGTYDHTYRNNDFFNIVTVDSWRYGARLDYEQGPWVMQTSYTHRDETSTSLNFTSETHDDVIQASAQNQRERGGTTLSYNFDQYSTVDNNVPGTGTDNTVSVGDTERFGSHEQYRLNTSASYSSRDVAPEPNDEFIANAVFSADHPHNFSSAYDFSYDRYTSGTFESDTYTANAQLAHQLYESLHSALALRASDLENSDQVNNGYVRRFGGGIIESYTKKLSTESRLSLRNWVFVDHTDQETIGTVQNEPHKFPEAAPYSFFLNFPNVDEGTIVITDDKHSQPPYMLMRDYTVLTINGRTQITWSGITGAIPQGGNVLVSYQALPTPPAKYETLTESFELRFDLWKNLVGAYGRINLQRNDAPASLLLYPVSDYTVGADTTWHWLRAGAEYEIYRSDGNSFNGTRLFQTGSFLLDDGSALSLDFTESWINYTEDNRNLTDYRFVSRYHKGLTYRLSLEVAAGLAYQSGSGTDETLATFRPSLRYVIGKTSIDATYDFEYELFPTQTRQQHVFSVRLRRQL
jgi:hypothetical protein